MARELDLADATAEVAAVLVGDRHLHRLEESALEPRAAIRQELAELALLARPEAEVLAQTLAHRRDRKPPAHLHACAHPRLRLLPPPATVAALRTVALTAAPAASMAAAVADAATAAAAAAAAAAAVASAPAQARTLATLPATARPPGEPQGRSGNFREFLGQVGPQDRRGPGNRFGLLGRQRGAAPLLHLLTQANEVVHASADTRVLNVVGRRLDRIIHRVSQPHIDHSGRFAVFLPPVADSSVENGPLLGVREKVGQRHTLQRPAGAEHQHVGQFREIRGHQHPVVQLDHRVAELVQHRKHGGLLALPRLGRDLKAGGVPQQRLGGVDDRPSPQHCDRFSHDPGLEVLCLVDGRVDVRGQGSSMDDRCCDSDDTKAQVHARDGQHLNLPQRHGDFRLVRWVFGEFHEAKQRHDEKMHAQLDALGEVFLRQARNQGRRDQQRGPSGYIRLERRLAKENAEVEEGAYDRGRHADADDCHPRA
mmetsp:Transcript_45941/g.133759  ORF Transcript_45941/g.133759 Transcript_45941/m.133759 type:complete len:482 (-) Transcript_45941:188-1633(-)